MAALSDSDSRMLRIVVAVLVVLQMLLWVVPLLVVPEYFANALGIDGYGVLMGFFARMLGVFALAMTLGMALAVVKPEENIAGVRIAMWTHAFATVVFIYYVARGVLSPVGSAMAFASMGFAIALYAVLRPSIGRGEEEKPEEQPIKLPPPDDKLPWA